MYRIELMPGEEAIFKSIDELVTGIRAGVILDTARIHHKASDKWLPIDVHPHYKVAKSKASGAAPTEAPAPAAVAAPSPLRKMPLPKLDGLPLIVIDEPTATTAVLEAPQISEPMLLRDAMPMADDIDLDVPPSYVPDPDEFAELAPRDESPAASALSGSPALLKKVALVVGALTLAGGGIAWMAARPSAKAPSAPTMSPVAAAGSHEETVTSFASSSGTPLRPLTVTPAGNAVSTPPTTLAAASARADSVAKARQARKDSIALAGDLPSAPSLAVSVAVPLPGESTSGTASGGAVTPAVLTRRYAAAYDAARAELDRNLSMFGFSNVFAAARLNAGDGVPATRTAIGAAENYVRSYHKRTGGIEQAFQDSLDYYAKRYNWSAEQMHAWQTGSQVEGADVQVVAGSLLKTTDAVFDLLTAEAGQYKVSGNTIAFADPQAARQYGQLRQQVNQLLASRTAGSNTSVGRLVRAIGSTRLPQEQ